MNAALPARAGQRCSLAQQRPRFIQHDWLARLRDAAYAAADHGIVGAACRTRADSLCSMSAAHEAEGLGDNRPNRPPERDVAQTQACARARHRIRAGLFRRDCIERIGVLDEAFHSYFEDTDYCLRAADAGIACVVAGGVTLRHHQHGSTSDDGGFREHLRRQSRAVFAARWQQRLLDRVRGNVHWLGHSRIPLAQSLLTRGLLGRLEARDLRMSFVAAACEVPSDDDFRVELATRRAVPAMPDVALMVSAEPLATPVQARLRSALVFGEWERLPATWVARCNALDLVIVPDEFQASVCRASGVITPIAIAALGIDREYMHADVPSRRHPDGRMVYLCIAEQLQRDAPDLVVRAFGNASPPTRRSR